MTSDDNARRFTYKRAFLVGLGFLSFSLVWPIFNQLVPIFLQAGNPQFEANLLSRGQAVPPVQGFALPPALALFIMTWDNLVNMVVQPWVGARSDRTWTRIGRRKPYIILGAPLAAVGFMLLPFARSATQLAACIFVTTIGMALFRTPTMAWLGDLFAPRDRSRASGILNLMAAVGSLVSFIAGGLLFTLVGRAAPFITVGLLMLAATGIAVWRVHEPRPSDRGSELDPVARAQRPLADQLRGLRQGDNAKRTRLLIGVGLWFMGFFALEAGLSSFAVFTLGIDPGRSAIYTGVVSLAFLLFAWPAGLIGSRWGHRKAILAGLCGLSTLFGLAYFVIHGPLAYVIILFLTGLFWDLVNINSLPMVYTYGSEYRIGAYTGLYTFSSQLAAVLGPVLSGLLVQSQGGEFRLIFPFAAVFFFAAAVVMFLLRRPAIVPVETSSPA